jgi:hypothetical protein
MARTFDNAVLEDFAVEEKDEPGAPVIIRHRFHAPGFARAEAGRLVAARGFYQAHLSQRFVGLARRSTPLLIEAPEKVRLTARIALPAGLEWATPPNVARLDTPFGSWERAEALLPATPGSPARLTLDERLTLKMARVAPERYAEFADFAAAVDKGQEREWIFLQAAPR